MSGSNLAVSVPTAAEVRTGYYTVGMGEGFKRQEKSATLGFPAPVDKDSLRDVGVSGVRGGGATPKLSIRRNFKATARSTGTRASPPRPGVA